MGCCGWPRSDWTPTKVIDPTERDRLIAERKASRGEAKPGETPAVNADEPAGTSEPTEAATSP